jgi:hypothetical protein
MGAPPKPLRGLHYSTNSADYDGHPARRRATGHVAPHVLVTFEGQVKSSISASPRSPGRRTPSPGCSGGDSTTWPPIQLAEDRGLDRRADVYAAGVDALGGRGGRRLWHDVSEPVIMRRVLEGRLPPPSSVNPRCRPGARADLHAGVGPSPRGTAKPPRPSSRATSTPSRPARRPNDCRALAEAMTREFGDVRQARHREIRGAAGQGRASDRRLARPPRGPAARFYEPLPTGPLARPGRCRTCRSPGDTSAAGTRSASLLVATTVAVAVRLTPGRRATPSRFVERAGRGGPPLASGAAAGHRLPGGARGADRRRDKGENPLRARGPRGGPRWHSAWRRRGTYPSSGASGQQGPGAGALAASVAAGGRGDAVREAARAHPIPGTVAASRRQRRLHPPVLPRRAGSEEVQARVSLSADAAATTPTPYSSAT